jgi:pimeloyl-ACP methyl ester carboxylesterase
MAVKLLHDFLTGRDRPLHLISHSTRGLVSLMYARRYPHKVSSLGLLAVGWLYAINLQAHYYTHLSAFSWICKQVVNQMVGDMLGLKNPSINPIFISYFKDDLACSPCPHSLFRMSNSRDEGGEIPLLICSRKTEFVVSPIVRRRWSKFIKKGSRLWECQNCRHYFHHFYPEQVGEKILNFLLSLHSLQANFNF